MFPIFYFRNAPCHQDRSTLYINIGHKVPRHLHMNGQRNTEYNYRKSKAESSVGNGPCTRTRLCFLSTHAQRQYKSSLDKAAKQVLSDNCCMKLQVE